MHLASGATPVGFRNKVEERLSAACTLAPDPALRAEMDTSLLTFHCQLSTYCLDPCRETSRRILSALKVSPVIVSHIALSRE